MTTCLQHMIQLHEICQFQTIEGSRVGTASKSEIRRWFQQGIVRINFEIVRAEDELPPVFEFTLFPKNEKKKTTLVLESNVIFIKHKE